MLIRAQLEDGPQTGNRRCAVRRTLRLGSVLPASGVEVTIRDLSVTGLLIKTAGDLTQGEVFEVEIPGHGAETATVVWQSKNFVGCSFKNRLPASAVSAALLRSPSKSAPDDGPSLSGEGQSVALQKQNEQSLTESVPAQGFDVVDWSERMPFDPRLIAAWLGELPRDYFEGPTPSSREAEGRGSSQLASVPQD